MLRRSGTQFVVLLVSLFIVSGALAGAGDKFGGIQLLQGYSIKEQWAIDAASWTIEKPGGPTIHFEAGPSEGSWADPKDRNQYSWYREQTLHGYKVRLALTKREVKTKWGDVGSGSGSILLVTFLLNSDNPYDTANFVSKVRNEQELADVLLMVLTFDPSKGGF